MSKFRLTLHTIATVFAVLLLASLANAQATRTWVSGVGDDVNPCSRTAPCKTFAGAISKTARNGEINVLDAGGFGAVTITKSITINGGHSQMASILFSATNGIIVNITDPADVRKQVRIYNLKLHGAPNASNTSPGLNGINFLAGSALHVSNCEIYNFSTAHSGINWVPSVSGELTVQDTIISDGGNGINISPTGGTTKALLENVKLHNNGSHGLLVTGAAADVTARNVVANGNTQNGISVQAQGHISLDNCVMSGNGTGLNASGGSAVANISNCVISQNTTAVTISSGDIFSFGNNRIRDNVNPGDVGIIFPASET